MFWRPILDHNWNVTNEPILSGLESFISFKDWNIKLRAVADFSLNFITHHFCPLHKHGSLQFNCLGKYGNVTIRAPNQMLTFCFIIYSFLLWPQTDFRSQGRDSRWSYAGGGILKCVVEVFTRVLGVRDGIQVRSLTNILACKYFRLS